MSYSSGALQEGVILVVANLRAETVRADDHVTMADRVGAFARPGGKHFAAGARLYVAYQDSAWPEQVRVLGRHRGGGRLVEVYLRTRDICNVRVRRVYHPRVLAALGRISSKGWGWVFAAEADAQEWAARLESGVAVEVANQPR